MQSGEYTDRPKGVQLSRSESRLSIEWSDGSVSTFSLASLRSACPCAQCRTDRDSSRSEGGALGLDIPLISSDAVEIDDVEIVGNYALQPTWRDGHRYGIYTWDYLRELSPPKHLEED